MKKKGLLAFVILLSIVVSLFNVGTVSYAEETEYPTATFNHYNGKYTIYFNPRCDSDYVEYYYKCGNKEVHKVDEIANGFITPQLEVKDKTHRMIIKWRFISDGVAGEWEEHYCFPSISAKFGKIINGKKVQIKVSNYCKGDYFKVYRMSREDFDKHRWDTKFFKKVKTGKSKVFLLAHMDRFENFYLIKAYHKYHGKVYESNFSTIQFRRHS